MRILIAEDSAPAALLLQRVLESAGHSVDRVADGSAAVLAAEEFPYDLIILDAEMPLLDGLSATRRIRAMQSARAEEESPILVLSGRHGASFEAECRLAGADASIAKVAGKPTGVLDFVKAWGGRGRDPEVPSSPGNLGLQPPPSGAPEGLKPGEPAAAPSWCLDEDLLDLMPAYVVELRKRAHALSDLLRENAYTEIAGLGHQLHGTAGSYGLPDLSAIGAQMERDARAGDGTALASLLERFRRSIDSLARMLPPEAEDGDGDGG